MVKRKKPNKFCYLLLGLGAGSGSARKKFSQKPFNILLKRANELSKFLNVDLWIAPLFDKPHNHNYYRFFLRFKYYKANDQLAQKIAETIMFSVDFIYTLRWGRDIEKFYFYFPKEKIKNKNKITVEQIIEYDETLDSWEQQCMHPQSEIGTATFIPDWIVAEGLRIAKITYSNKNIHLALSFIYHGRNNFYIESVDIPEAISDGNIQARNSLEQSRWENALQNYFKAIEAIIGDPPKNDDKFLSKLKKAGINPKSLIGIENGKPIFEQIRKMNNFRDAKAAHGSSPNRNIGLRDMVDFQLCANEVIWKNIEYILGSKINLRQYN